MMKLPRGSIIKAISITVLAMVLSACLVVPLSASISIFRSPEKNEFEMSDLFASVADARPVRYLDDRIVILDIGLNGREGITEALEMLALCEPAAIGLDINFEQPMDSAQDARLVEAIANLPQIVVPVFLSAAENKDGIFDIEQKPFFYTSHPDFTYASTNLVTKAGRKTVRRFPVLFSTQKGELPSFVTALAALGAPVTAERLLKRGNDTETIDYPSREFNVYPLENISELAEQLNGKFVLIGAMGDAADMHATPIDDYVAGILIHACALASILDGTWYTRLADLADYILGFLLCFVMVYLCLVMDSKMKSMVLRVLQVAALYIAVRAGYALYVDNHVILNFSYTLLMLTFGLFAVDVWNGTEALVDITRKGWRRHCSRKAQSKNLDQETLCEDLS